MSHLIVVMGVAGCGKSTLAQEIARLLDMTFIEGDELHPPENVAKMSAGIALTDEDRWPFLHAVASALVANAATGAVASCSALKHIYRDFIRKRVGAPVLFVMPDLDRQALWARLSSRTNHFMPVSLFESQMATLEPPSQEEWSLLVDGRATPHAQARQVESWLSAIADTAHKRE